VARRAHHDREGSASESDLQRLLPRDGVLEEPGAVAIETGDGEGSDRVFLARETGAIGIEAWLHGGKDRASPGERQS
jgi:hypothetical protein